MPKSSSTSGTLKKSARNAVTKPKAKAAKAAKDPRASHLYTDDNPSTTIHGTGFKDKAAALRTLGLISKRSLIYQFQTVNTMYHRAKHHPSMKKAVPGSASTAGMREAMEVFKHWIDVTYPAERDALRTGGFKPLLSKGCLQRYLSKIEGSEGVSEDAKAFARIYSGLPKGKKLGNLLVNTSKPEGPDWDIKRYEALDGLVPKGKEEGADAWKLSELWQDDRELSDLHLHLVAWAWTPAGESKLP